MKRILLVLTLVAAGTAVASAPASAHEGGPICMLNQNTWLRAEPTGIVLRTLGAGRGFRVHHGSSDWYGSWLYGHGAEAPGQDGWIPHANCTF